MSRKLVVFDVDSTLIDNEVIELIAEHAGTRALVAEVTERAMRGEIDFAQSLRERVATLKGVPVAVFDDVFAAITVTTGVPETLSTLHDAGHLYGAVSGGFHEILDRLAVDLNLDFARANRLETENGVLTGRVLGEIIDSQAKADALKEWADAARISIDDTIAVGDGANDLTMMAAANLGIAFCAKPVVAEKADVSISIRDMRLILPYVL